MWLLTLLDSACAEVNCLSTTSMNGIRNNFYIDSVLKLSPFIRICYTITCVDYKGNATFGLILLW
jgi:hypothetical protein